jgi:hypothetical protein
MRGHQASNRLCPIRVTCSQMRRMIGCSSPALVLDQLVESAGVFRATPKGEGITQLHQGPDWAVDNPDLHALNHPF